MKICDNCESVNVVLTTRDIYGANLSGKWPVIWFCMQCKASVGCHPDTDNPLGYMANRYIRKLRVDAHVSFDPIWRSGFMSRPRAERWIQKQLNLETEFHISQLSKDDLHACIEICQEYLAHKQHKDIGKSIKLNKERRVRNVIRKYRENSLQRERRIRKRS